MWSSFAQRHQLEPGADGTDGGVAPKPLELPCTKQQHDSDKHHASCGCSSGDDVGNGGAWSDDDDILFEDEDREYPEEAVVVQDNGGLIAAVTTAAELPPRGDRRDEGTNGGDEGGLGGLLQRSGFSSFASAPQRCASPPPSSVPSASVEDGWDGGGVGERDDSMEKLPLEKNQKNASAMRGRPSSGSPLDRVAERFGAALLASIDNDDSGAVGTTHREVDNCNFSGTSQGQDGNGDGDCAEESMESRGNSARMDFAGGFVMKGLSRFIEAATAPQESEEEASELEEENDGWSDDYDDIDIHGCEGNGGLAGDGSGIDNNDNVGNSEESPGSVVNVVEIDRTGGDKELTQKEHSDPTPREAGRSDQWGDECANLDILRKNVVGAGANNVNEGNCSGCISGRWGGKAKESLISQMKEKVADCDIKAGLGESSGWENDADALDFSDGASVGNGDIDSTLGIVDRDNGDKIVDPASECVSIDSLPRGVNTYELHRNDDEKDLPPQLELGNGAKTTMSIAAQTMAGVLEKDGEDWWSKEDDDVDFLQESDAVDKSPASALDDANIEETGLLVSSTPIRLSDDKDDCLGHCNKIGLLGNETPSSSERKAGVLAEDYVKDAQKELFTTPGEDAGVVDGLGNDDGLEFQDKDNTTNNDLSEMGGAEDGVGGQPALCLPGSGKGKIKSCERLKRMNAEAIDRKHCTQIDNELPGEGLDDIDSTKSRHYTPRNALSKEEIADSAGRSGNNSVSNSIRKFVAKTEMALDSEFHASLWKTPSPRMDPLGFDRDDSSGSSDGMDEPTRGKDQVKPVSVTSGMSRGDGGPPGVREEIKMSAGELEEDMLVSRSLKELVDGLDAELNNFVRDAAATPDGEVAERTTEKGSPTEVKTLGPRHHCYEESKDDSPEPVADSLSSLPHQQSWYLNAMEGGKGGVVYDDKALQSPFVMGSVIQCPSSSVGMPLSEMASKTNLPKGSDTDNSKADDGEGQPDSVAPAKHSDLQAGELRCRCLELIMPLPDNDIAKNESIGPLQCPTPPGFGTKELPNGTTVLVNYEQLLQNEVTKRILLQRSVEAYERRETSLSSGHASGKVEGGDLTALKLVYEQRDEINSLRETMQRLQDEKENMVAEAQLFEAELAASVNDKEYLERELEVLQQEVKQGEMARKDVEARLVVEVGERARHEAEVETMRVELKSKEDYFESKCKEELEEKSQLIDKIETLQSDLSGARAEQERFGAERHLLEQERDQLVSKVEELMELEPAAFAPVNGDEETLARLINQLEKLRSDSSTLQVERDVLEQERDQLADRVEELVATAAKAAAVSPSSTAKEDVALLKGTVESLRDNLDKSDKLSSRISKASEPVEVLSENQGIHHADLAQTSSLLCLSDENESLRVAGSQQGSQLSELKDKKISTWGKTDELADQVAMVTHAEAEALRVENSMLNERLVDLRRSFAQLEHQKLDLERNSQESASAVRSLEGQIKGSDVRVAELSEQLSQARVSLNKKTTECEESSFALQMLRAELDKAEEKLISHGEAERRSAEANLLSLKSENDNLSNQLAGLRSSHISLERDLEKAMEERSNVLQSHNEQVKNVNIKEAELTGLREELSCMRLSLQDKAQTCQGLNVQLQESQNDREVIYAKSQEDADRAQEQKLRLQSRINKLLSEHNATVSDLEGQLANSSQRSSSLQAQFEEYRLRLADSENECASISQSMSSTISEYTAQVSKLQEEKFELSTALKEAQSSLELKQLEASGDSAKINQLQRSVDGMQQEIESIAHRHQELLDRNHHLEQENAELESKVDEAEEQATNSQLEREKLRDANTEREQTIKTLNEHISALNDANDEKADCLVQNEAVIKERDELRHEKCLLLKQIDELASRADAAGRCEVLPNVTSAEKEVNELRDELTSLHEERQQLDLDNEELLVQLGLMQQMQQDKLENQVECEAELEQLREQVSALQDKCDRLQDNALESKHGEKGEATKDPNKEQGDKLCETITQLSHENDSLKAQISELRQKVKEFVDLGEKGGSLDQTISELKEENCTLKDQVCDLTQNIEGLELQNSQIIKTLRQKLGLLELKLADKEEELESAKRELNKTLEVKDKEIFNLTSECLSRKDDLKTVSSQLDAAKNEMGNINSQLESLKGQYLSPVNVGEEHHSKDHDEVSSLQDLLADAVLDSNDDYLRHQIVVLARALERSELDKADALERIFSERKSRSEGLRQLGESVKRFYISVRCSDAA